MSTFDISHAEDKFVSAVSSTNKSDTCAKAGGVFTIQCHDKDGLLKWETSKHNLVVNEGLKFMNDKFFTGSAYTAAWYIGLYGSGATNSRRWRYNGLSCWLDGSYGVQSSNSPSGYVCSRFFG